MSGHVFRPCVFFQFHSMYFFTLIQYKINVVVVKLLLLLVVFEPDNPLLLVT